MSYDLMVFDPKASPSERESFMDWYKEQSQWGEGHTYNDPDISTAELRAWFFDMIRQYPPMNGPHAPNDVDDPKQTDYAIGKSIIYACFAWSEAVAAHKATFALAEKHRVGFFDVSTNNGGVWTPNESGGYTCVHGQVAPEESNLK
jgi:hypothetical protein